MVLVNGAVELIRSKLVLRHSDLSRLGHIARISRVSSAKVGGSRRIGRIARIDSLSRSALSAWAAGKRRIHNFRTLAKQSAAFFVLHVPLIDRVVPRVLVILITYIMMIHDYRKCNLPCRR